MVRSTRRQFLQLTGATAAGAVVFAGCSPRAGELLVQSAARLPEDMVTGIDNWYATICRMCPAGCGIIVRVMEGRAKKIEGNPDYPVNRGKLCARGQAGLQALYHPDRIQGPLRRNGDKGSGRFEPITWDAAVNELMGKLKELRTGQTPGELLLVTPPLTGHLALVLQRFAQAPGSGLQIATFEALEEARSTRMAVAQALGLGPAPTPVPFFDVANARFILSFGANFLDGWLSPVHYGVAYGQFRGRPQARGVLVQIEPRVTSSGASADQWIPIKPGTEGILALGIAQVVMAGGLADPTTAAQLEALTRSPRLEAYQPSSVAAATGVPEDQIVALARRLAGQGPSLVIAGGPAAAQSNGRFNLTAILSLNRLVRSVGQSGGISLNPPSPLPEVPASSSPWPSAWWQGLAQAISSGQPWPNANAPLVTPPKVLMVRGANPVHSLPAAFGFKDALAGVPYIVSFSSFMDETAALADLVLPEHTYLEDWGSDIPEPGPGFQVMGFQQPVVNRLYDTRSFGDVLLGVASELGLSQDLPWKTFKDVLREGAQGLFRLRRGSIQATGFEEYWMRLLQRGGWWDEGARGPAAPLPGQGSIADVEPPTFAGSEQEYPFHLLPFPSSSMDEGSGANVPWLQATPDPITTAVWQTWVEVNLETGRRMGLQEGDIVKVESPQSSLEAPVYLHPGLRPDVVAIPMGQGHTLYGRYARDRGANVFELLDPMLQKPDGGLAWAATRVRIIKTGKSGRVSKSEGQVMAVEPSDVDIVGVVRQ